ncbi:MAG: HAD family hydrolase [Candidatus Hodarchaeota archaeon]
MKFKAVVFDMDGTLTDTMRIIPTILAEELGMKPYGRKFAKFQNWLAPYYYRNHSWMNKSLPFHLAKLFNRSLLSICRIFARSGIRYVKSLNDNRLFPGTMEALSSLNELGIDLGLATNGRRIEVNRKLPPKVRNIFKVIVTKDWGIPKKPKPDLVLHAAKQLGINPKEMIYVGDTLADMLASKAAGCEFILVSTGTFGSATVAINGIPPNHIIQDLRDVPNLVRNLTRA